MMKESAFPAWSCRHVLFNASVVGSNDEDGFFQHACLCNGLDDAAHITVEFFQFGVIFRSIVSGLMAYMVGVVKANGKKGRLFLLDILFCHTA